MTIEFFTLGCKLNQAETEALAAHFEALGFIIKNRLGTSEFKAKSSFAEPDLIIVNSCTVTARSDQKVRRQARFFAQKYPQALIIISGCLAEVDYQRLVQLFQKYKNVRILKQTEKDLLFVWAEKLTTFDNFFKLAANQKAILWDSFLTQNKKNHHPNPFIFSTKAPLFHSRAFLKIQDGCNNRCAYCRVPLARGKSISLPFAQIKEAVLKLELKGFSEIVLTGVNISSYRDEEIDLALLLEKLLGLERNIRFRLSSLEPNALTEKLCCLLQSRAICPSFHLPIQSGSDIILAKMGRLYQVKDIILGVERLRKSRPEAYLSADVIVGFPNETEKDFRATVNLIKELKFAALHVFPFSARPKTPAANFKNDLSPSTLKKRVKNLVKLSKQHKRDFLKKLIGQSLDIVLERSSGKDLYWGTSEFSFRCLVAGIQPVNLVKGKRVIAKAFKLKGESLETNFEKLLN